MQGIPVSLKQLALTAILWSSLSTSTRPNLGLTKTLKDIRACWNRIWQNVRRPADTSIMYPDGYSTDVTVKALSRILEGATRTNHFQGVTTIVTKLLLSCLPDIAYFGAKDFQQQAIIRRMCLDLNIPVEIKTCPIIRDTDGLALSSRNAYLSAEEREAGLSLSRALRLAEEKIAAGETDIAQIKASMQQLLNATPLLKLDYATIVDPTTLEDISTAQSEMAALIAARVGTTRLIDNCQLTPAPAE